MRRLRVVELPVHFASGGETRVEQHDPEAVFDAFLRNANGARDEDDEITRNDRRPLPQDNDIVLLTDVKQPASVVALRSEAAQRKEAESAVPNVGLIGPPPLPVREGSEDGQIPAGELDRVLSDMTVLVRYGHHGQVREQLEALTCAYPEDILLLRRIVEFHVENKDSLGAIDTLFILAGRLFERRNTVGMRQALEQVLVIEPDNRRAYKLLGLLEQRPVTGTGG
jgi:hypothetical protein